MAKLQMSAFIVGNEKSGAGAPTSMEFDLALNAWVAGPIGSPLIRLLDASSSDQSAGEFCKGGSKIETGRPRVSTFCTHVSGSATISGSGRSINQINVDFNSGLSVRCTGVSMHLRKAKRRIRGSNAYLNRCN